SLSRFPFQRLQPYQTLFRSVSGSNLNSGGLWIGLRLSADPTLPETFDRKIGFAIRSKESMALRKSNFR
ncbi:hypothetical protein ACWD4K_32070, partial [Streptomyces gelaticus]